MIQYYKKLLLELAARAITSVHLKYQTWSWMDEEMKLSEINNSEGILRADEPVVCDAITQEFIQLGMWKDYKSENQIRGFVIEREFNRTSDNSEEIDIIMLRKDSDSKLFFPAFIEAKRYKALPTSFLAKKPEAKLNLDKIRNDIDKLMKKYKFISESGVQFDNCTYKHIFANILVWGDFTNFVEFEKEKGREAVFNSDPNTILKKLIEQIDDEKGIYKHILNEDASAVKVVNMGDKRNYELRPNKKDTESYFWIALLEIHLSQSSILLLNHKIHEILSKKLKDKKGKEENESDEKKKMKITNEIKNIESELKDLNKSEKTVDELKSILTQEKTFVNNYNTLDELAKSEDIQSIEADKKNKYEKAVQYFEKGLDENKAKDLLETCIPKEELKKCDEKKIQPANELEQENSVDLIELVKKAKKLLDDLSTT